MASEGLTCSGTLLPSFSAVTPPRVEIPVAGATWTCPLRAGRAGAKEDTGNKISIFHHNAIDILTLACLTAIVPSARGSNVTVLLETCQQLTCAERLGRLRHGQ